MQLDRELRAFYARPRKLSRTITHADLTAAVNGEEQAISLGSLPPGAVVTGRSVTIETFFTGGSATAVTMALGTAADPDLFMAALNVFDTTATETPVQGTAGVSPVGPASGEVLATFDADAGHTLLALTAGELTVALYYSVPDAGG